MAEDKTKKYFVIKDYTVSGVAVFRDLRSAIRFAKSCSKGGMNTKIFVGTFLKGYDAEIKLIEDNSPDWTSSN